MKPTTLMAAALLCAVGTPDCSSAAGATDSFYCDLNALSAEQRTRQRQLGRILRYSVRAARETRRGYEFEFPADAPVYSAVVEFIALETACCPFLEFSVRVSAERGPLFWTLGGRKGVKDLIRAEFTWLLERG